jgi:hypothetical protein
MVAPRVRDRFTPRRDLHPMRTDTYLRVVLTVIAAALCAIAIRPLAHPVPAAAQTVNQDLYIEPGVYLLRSPDAMKQQLGKVMIDLHTGNIWGFPTASDTPYPVKLSGSAPPVSQPFLLGRFDLDAMHN